MSHLSKISVSVGLMLALFASLPVVAQDMDTEFKLAAGFYSRGQWGDAAAAFEAIAQRYPETEIAIKAKFFQAETEIQQQAFASAYGRFQEFLIAHSQHPLAARAMFRMGESALRLGNQAVALRILEEFTREYPDENLNQFALPYLGQLRIKRGEPQLAERIFGSALKRFPDGQMVAECQLGLGKALLEQGDVVGAQRVFSYCITSFSDQTAIAERAQIQLGACALVSEPQRIALAEQRFKAVIEDTSSPEIQAEATLSLARLLNQSNRQDESFALLEPVVGRELEAELKMELLFEAALAATKTDRIEQAIQWLGQVRMKARSVSKQKTVARFELTLLQMEGRVVDAIGLAEKYNLSSEKRLLISTAQEEIGRQQYAEGKFEKSLETFHDLVELEDVDAQRKNVWHYFRALNLIGLRRFAKAETALGQIDFEIADASLKSLAELCVASVKFRQEKFAEAIPLYRSYLGQTLETEDRPQAILELTICLGNTKQFAAADERLSAMVAQHRLSESQERVVESVAGQAATESHSVGAKWYQWLAENSNDRSRQARSTSQLITLGLDKPLVQQSVEQFEQLFTRSPGDARLVAAAVKKASDLEETEQWSDAIKLYQLLVENPNSKMLAVSKVARLKLATCYQKLEGKNNLAMAEEQLQAWLENTDGQAANVVAEVVYQLAWVQNDRGERKESQECFQQIVDEFPDSKYWPDAAYRVVEQLATGKQFAAAKSVVAELVAASNVPSEILGRARFLQGKLGVATGDWQLTETAMAIAVPVLENSKARNTAKYLLAESRFQLGKLSLAMAGFAELQTKISEQRPKYQPWIELRLGTLLLEQDKISRAFDVATDAYQRYAKFSSRHEFRFLIARCLESRGLLNDARVGFEQVIQSPFGKGTETAAHAQWRIGETYFHQEKYQEAIAAYYKVDSLYEYGKWRGAALLQAGKCQEHLSNVQNAVKLYQVLLSRYPGSEFALETEQRLKNLKAAQTKTATKTSQQKF